MKSYWGSQEPQNKGGGQVARTPQRASAEISISTWLCWCFQSPCCARLQGCPCGIPTLQNPFIHPQRLRFPYFFYIMTRFQTVYTHNKSAATPTQPLLPRCLFHWPYSEQCHTNIGLARGRCLFPGFPSTGLTSTLCPAVILLNPAWIMSLSAQKLPGAPHCCPDQVQQKQLRPQDTSNQPQCPNPCHCLWT